LHQHIFKVGWLVTKQYQTTTILYYAFFLPGIILNQAVFWLGAGFLNVSAERSIAWPQRQEIGELKLDFIRLSKNVGSFRLAIISTLPLLVALAVVGLIANNILNVPSFLINLTTTGGSFLNNLGPALTQFTAAPDFWIWVYFAFTISNTMMPDLKNLRGWRVVLIALAIAIVILYIVGAGDQVLMENLHGPVANVLNSLSSIFAIIIGLDLFMVAVLGTLEALIERVTGNSATFENGKMITMRRSELLAKRAQALAQSRPQARIAARSAARATPSGPPSIYKLPLPIPGAPGKEAVTHDEGIVIQPDPKLSIPPAVAAEGRAGPSVITGTVAEKLPPPSPPVTSSPAATSPAAPTARPAAPPAAVPSTASPFAKPAAPAAASPTAPVARPAAPPASPSPFSKPAAKPDTDDSETDSDVNMEPAKPMGTIRTAAVTPPPKPAAPAPKPASAFILDDDDEPEDDEDDSEDDDEVTYEDFEDPA